MEKKNKKENTVRVHRIGSITFGISLIVFGILFLLHMLVPVISYTFIFRLWPCIFIILGIEILIGNYKEGSSFVYDKTAVFLLIVLSFFAMSMAVADYCMLHIYPDSAYFYLP